MTELYPETPDVQPEPAGISFAAILVGLTLLAIGVIWMLDLAGIASVSWFVVFSIALFVVGLALVVGSFSGGHDALITIGVILTVLLTIATFTDTRFEGGVGDREHSPTSIENLNDSYRLVAGTMTLDLRQVDFPQGETRLEVRVGMGQVELFLPPDVAVFVDWNVAAGNVSVFGREQSRDQSGLFLDDNSATDDYQHAERRLFIDVNVTLGSIEVSW